MRYTLIESKRINDATYQLVQEEITGMIWITKIALEQAYIHMDVAQRDFDKILSSQEA